MLIQDNEVFVMTGVDGAFHAGPIAEIDDLLDNDNLYDRIGECTEESAEIRPLAASAGRVIFGESGVLESFSRSGELSDRMRAYYSRTPTATKLKK